MADTTLYHYCSNDAFHGIVSSRSIRLSSLSLSNDTMEGKLAAQAIARLCERDGLSDDAIKRLLNMFDSLEKVADGLGFSLSEKGDLLSQWRGYASDATGVSIGFSKPYLEWLVDQSANGKGISFELHQVEYEPEFHDRKVEQTYNEIRRLIDEGAFADSHLRTLLDIRTEDEYEADQKKSQSRLNQLALTLFGMISKLFLLKSRAFSEEREWRLLSYLFHGIPVDCSFSPSKDRLVPYRAITLANGITNPIVEVILGPKHLTPNHVVATFLKNAGFGEASVRRSEASYR